jgi:hypothetical protein
VSLVCPRVSRSSIVTRDRRIAFNEFLACAAGQSSKRDQWVDQGIDGGDGSGRARPSSQQTRKEESLMSEPSTNKATELAQRSNGGLDVTLVWVQEGGKDTILIRVCDRREGACFEIPTEPYLALDVYYHPFAYRTSPPSITTRLASRRSPMIQVGAYRTRSDAL